MTTQNLSSPVFGTLIADKLVCGTTVISTGTDNVNISGIKTIFVNTSGGDVYIGGTTNGVYSQEINIVKTTSANNLIIKNLHAASTQKIRTNIAQDLIIPAGGYGGITLTLFTQWYMASSKILPTMLPNLALWLSAIRSPITKDFANIVTQWNDISGNNRHATDASAIHSPTWGINTINGIETINFGNGQYLDVDLSFLVGTSYTIYAVTRKTVASGGQLYYLLSTDYNPNQPNRCLHIGYFNPVTAKFDQYGNPCDCTIPAYSGIQNQLWSMYFENGVGRITTYISDNNKYQAIVTSSPAPDPMLSASDGKIGCGYDTTNFFRDDIAEIIIFDTNLSTIQQQFMRAYLQTTWGMTIQ